MLPVVEPGALHFALVEREPQRLDQMQLRTGGKAAAPHIPGVPMDFGVHEHDVECHSVILIRTFEDSGEPMLYN